MKIENGIFCRSLRNDCPSFVMLRASKDGKHLEVVGVNNEHNHECTDMVNQNLPHQRKLPEDVKQEVVEMMLLHIDRKKIIDYVKKKTNKTITVKDLFNLKAKYKNFNFKLERSKDDILKSMGLSELSGSHLLILCSTNAFQFRFQVHRMKNDVKVMLLPWQTKVRNGWECAMMTM